MPILELRGVSKTFHQPGGRSHKAVDNVDLHVEPGECVAIVGESGSGKSTLARIALGLTKADVGDVRVAGMALYGASDKQQRAERLKIQPVFQDPTGSFNPRRTVFSSLDQAIRQRPGHASDVWGTASELLSQVGLYPADELLKRYPHELSGGQRQRLAIARALASQPEIIVADEPLSGADVSIRAQVLNLLEKLRRQKGLAYLLITHDMLVAEAIADRVAVMFKGQIVEQGSARQVIDRPQHHYTKRLLAAVQSVDAHTRESV